MTFEEIVDIRCEKAMAEGRAEGREEGREEGRAEGRQALIMTLLENYEPAKVAEMLKLSIDQVQAVIEK